MAWKGKDNRSALCFGQTRRAVVAGGSIMGGCEHGPARSLEGFGRERVRDCNYRLYGNTKTKKAAWGETADRTTPNAMRPTGASDRR